MPTLLWFRRDLRLHDLPALLDAVTDTDEVLASFVLDPRLEASSGKRRVQYLCNSLQQLQNDLDGRLLVTRGQPEERIPLIAKEVAAQSVHVSEDFAPFGCRRDNQVRAALREVPLVTTGSPISFHRAASPRTTAHHTKCPPRFSAGGATRAGGHRHDPAAIWHAG